jgi:hypothetical protein
MSPKERRAFARGYRLALRRARKELDAMAQRDDEIAEFTDEMRAAREQTVRHIGDDLVELMREMQGMRNEFYRLKAVEEAIDTERDPDALLN